VVSRVGLAGQLNVFSTKWGRTRREHKRHGGGGEKQGIGLVGQKKHSTKNLGGIRNDLGRTEDPDHLVSKKASEWIVRREPKEAVQQRRAGSFLRGNSRP